MIELEPGRNINPEKWRDPTITRFPDEGYLIQLPPTPRKRAAAKKALAALFLATISIIGAAWRLLPV